MGGRQDASATAPSGGRGDAAAAEHTPALRQRPRPRDDRVPVRAAVGKSRDRPGDVPGREGRRALRDGYLQGHLRLLCKICQSDPGLIRVWVGSSLLLEALRF